MPDTRTRPAEPALPRPRVDPFPLALAATVLGETDLVPALWDASHGRPVRGASREARLAATWLGLFIGEEGPSVRRSPVLPTGTLPQFPRLERAGLIEELGGPGEAPSYGLSRSNWDFLFLSAINPKTISALRQVMMLGWPKGDDPVPLSELTRAIPPVRADGGLSRARVPHELVLAGMHLSGMKVDLTGGPEPLIYVEMPQAAPRRSDPNAPVPSLLDGGWLTPIPEGARTDLAPEDLLNRRTGFAHLFRAAALFRDAVRETAWDPEMNIDLRSHDDASGLSALFARPGVLATRSSRGEKTFMASFTPLAESWFSGLNVQNEAMSVTNGPGLWPDDPEKRGAQITLLLAQQGLTLSSATAASGPLLSSSSFGDLIRDHADAEGKAGIDELLQLRGGVLKNPVARFWQSLCLRHPDRTVTEMGAEPAPDADPRLNAIRIGDLLLVHPRKPVLQLLSEAERAGCRGVMSLSETGPDAPVDLFKVAVGDQETLAGGLFERAPSDPSHRAEQRLKGRDSVLGGTGLGGTEEAIRALNRSSLPVRKPRYYQVAHDYLIGRGSMEIAEELGLSRGRVSQMIRSAVLTVDRERGAGVGLTTLLNGLSARSQNALRQRSFGTDEGVRALVGKYGSAALKVLPNLGKESHEEICAAFGFDPEERLRLPGREKHEADRLRAVPNLARDRHNRDARLLDIFEADPDLTDAADPVSDGIGAGLPTYPGGF